MKILVIGANGFIGRHVTATLTRLGHALVRADIVPGDGADCVVLDPDNPDYTALFRSNPCDVCINCSGAASVPVSFADPLHDFTLNTLRVVQMLEAMRRAAPGTRYVHLSSAAVYGNPARTPIQEADPARPVSPYGWHKLHAEQFCLEYTQLHAVGTLSLRIFSAYGPGLRKQLFWDVFQKARKGRRIELFGTGDEARDFIYVEDIGTCIDLLVRTAEFDGRAVNVASGRSVTVRTAVSELLAALQWDREVVFSGDQRVGDPNFWQADISRIREKGFEPAHALALGLQKTADWMRTL